MGLCASAAPVDTFDQERTEAIEKYMHTDFVKSCQSLAVLVLGPSAGGKATLFKQLKLLYSSVDHNGNQIDPGFKKQDITKYRRLIHMSTISNMKELIDQAPNYFSEGVLDVQAGQAFEYISEDEKFDTSVELLLKRLWSDPGVQAAFENAHEFGLADSAGYFFDLKVLGEISKENYVPTPEHILRVQDNKYGIISLQLHANGIDYVLHDVSAQKNRKKKWLYKFEENIKIIIFMVSMDQYNEPSRQNGDVDGVTHGMAEFLEICEESTLKKYPILIVMNRYDQFQKKIVNSAPWEYRHANTIGGVEDGIDDDNAVTGNGEQFVGSINNEENGGEQPEEQLEEGPWSDSFEIIGPIEDHEKGAETYIPAATEYFKQKFLNIATYTKRGPKAGKNAPPVDIIVTSVLEHDGTKEVFRKIQEMILKSSK
jgi:guanine nucleotide-binding protein G(t) subunit alpha 3